MRTGKPDHLTSFDYLGIHRYFLTFCTFERQRLFATADRVNAVLLQFARAAADERFTLIAYCFMPDHVHLLVEGHADDSDCRRFIARAKQFSGFYFKKRFGQALWQRYGYERVLRHEDATLSVARYVVENPVRAGIVTDPTSYPFIGSGVYRIEQILEGVQMERRWSG